MNPKASFFSCNPYRCGFFAVLAVALGLRLHGLGRESFFVDELRQSASYGLSIKELVKVAAKQNLPPFDYWLGHLITRISQTDFMLRLPAALFGVGAIAILMLLVRRHFSTGLSIFAGSFLSLLPFHLYLSQNLRPYSSAIFLCTATMAVWDRFLTEDPSAKRFIVAFLVFTPFLLTRPDGPVIFLFIFVVIMGILLFKSRWFSQSRIELPIRQYLILSMAAGLAAVSYFPFFKEIARMSPQVVNEGLDMAGSITLKWSSMSLYPLWTFFCALMEPLGPLLFPLSLAGAIIALFRKKYSGKPILAACGAALLITPVVHLFLWQLNNSWNPQAGYFFYLLPLCLITLCVLFDSLSDMVLPKLSTKSRTAATFIPGLLVMGLLPFTFSYKTTPQMEDWKNLCGYLKDNFKDGAVLLFDDVVPIGGFEHTFYGFPRYFNPDGLAPGNVNYAKEDILLTSDYHPSPIFLNSQFLQYYRYKWFKDIHFLPPMYVLDIPGKRTGVNLEFLRLLPEQIQQMSWQENLASSGRYRPLHVAFLPFISISDDVKRQGAVLILHYHWDLDTTGRSRFPHRRVPYQKTPDRRILENDPRIKIVSFKGFQVISLTEPSQNFDSDVLALLKAVLPAMPADSSRIDMLLTICHLEKDLGYNSWQTRILQILYYSNSEGIDVSQIEEIMKPYY